MVKSTRLSATPLMSIDAVSLDTETTGLDTKTARVIQIGALAIHEGAVDEAHQFDTLVAPGIPIPPETTDIHGISDVMVKDALAFGAIADELDAFIQDRILIGHSIGFDLAILENEHRIAGLLFRRPRSLCTAMLARIALPDMPAHSLDMVAARLGVTVKDRHSALGDARTTAEVFLALAPCLREKNIRTLAEAEAACRQLSHVMEEHYRAGWAEPVADRSVSLSEQALARLDAYPYRHRVQDVMSHPPLWIESTASLRAALTVLAEKKISALFVADSEPLKRQTTGIITERDVLRIIAQRGEKAFDLPVGDISSKTLECVYEDAFLYRAIGRMTRMNIRHLAVQDEYSNITGVISQRDMLRMRATDAISLGDEIDTAKDSRQLGAAWAKLPLVARGLMSEGASGRDIAGVVSRELCAMTRRAAQHAESAMIKEGLDEPPVEYAVLVLGSGGRGESMLAPDQDNAIVYEDSGDNETIDKWFAELGKRVADELNAVGIPYCKGGIMAANPPWRRSVSEWHEQIDDWLRRSQPEDLLNVDIFYDFRAVYGKAELGRQMWDYAYEHGQGQRSFAQALAQQIGNYSAPTSFFGGFKTENGRVDLKKGGLFAIVSFARALAIRHNIRGRSTLARLQNLRDKDIGGKSDIEAMIDTHAMIVDLITRQQLDDIANGLPPGNSIDPKKLSSQESSELRAALSALNNIGHLAQDLISQ